MRTLFTLSTWGHGIRWSDLQEFSNGFRHSGWRLSWEVVVDGMIRVRSVVWSATAVVMAVVATVLVMQAWQADAAPGDEDSTFVPIANCRLFDFRPGSFNIGPKDTPLGPGEASVFTQSVTGTNGDCTIPGDATAVAMNVTILNSTAQSNLRVFPAEVPTPNSSNLNWLAGQSPIPNLVAVKVSPAGNIKLYNEFGTVNVLADVVGYYTASSLKEIAQSLKGMPFAKSEFVNVSTTLTATATPRVTVSMTAPVAGRVTVNSTAYVSVTELNGSALCAIVKVADLPISIGATTESVQIYRKPEGAAFGSLSGTRGFSIAAGATVEYTLACGSSSTGAKIEARNLTAIFTPDP